MKIGHRSISEHLEKWTRISPLVSNRDRPRAHYCATSLWRYIGRIFVRTDLRHWPKNLQQTRTKLLSAAQKVTSPDIYIYIVSLRNEGYPTFYLCLTTVRHLGFTETLRNSWGRRSTQTPPPGAMLWWPFRYQFHVCGCDWYKLYSGKCCINVGLSIVQYWWVM